MRTFRLLRFRLRTLLLLVLLVSLPLAWYAVNARQYAAEMAALDRLRPVARGALLLQREGEGLDWSGPVYIEATMNWLGPDWTRRLLTQWRSPILYRVTELRFASPSLVDSDVMTTLSVFPKLRRIEIDEYRTDAPLRDGAEPACVSTLREIFPKAAIEYRPDRPG